MTVLSGRNSTAATPGARFIDPAVLARIGNLELLARTVVDGFISGLHRSPFRGLSIDFAEHRPYMPGDDIRRIDWRVFARSDRLYIKEYEADTNANMSVILDISKSMDFASDDTLISKLDYGRFLAASLLYLSNQQRDRVGLVTFDNDIVSFVPPSAKHFTVALHTLDQLSAGSNSRFAAPLLKLAERLNRRSILALISDFYDDPDRILNALLELRYRGNDMIVFHILDPAELNFDYASASSFEDLETAERIPVIPDKFRPQYQSLVKEHIGELEQRFSDNRIDYAFIDTSAPLDRALFHYLSERARLSRVR